MHAREKNASRTMVDPWFGTLVCKGGTTVRCLCGLPRLCSPNMSHWFIQKPIMDHRLHLKYRHSDHEGLGVVM